MKPSYLQDLFQVLQFDLELAFLLHGESSSPLGTPGRARHVQPSPESRRTEDMEAIRICPEWEGYPAGPLQHLLRLLWSGKEPWYFLDRLPGAVHTSQGHQAPRGDIPPAPSYLHHTQNDWLQLGIRPIPGTWAILYALDVVTGWGGLVTLV